MNAAMRKTDEGDDEASAANGRDWLASADFGDDTAPSAESDPSLPDLEQP